MELPAESQSLFSPGRNPVDNLIASFSQPDSDDEELAQMNELGLNQDLKVPSNRENSLTPEFLELPERTPNHDKSFLNASTNGNDKERSVTPELDLPSTSTFDISSNEAKCSKTPRQEFSFAM